MNGRSKHFIPVVLMMSAAGCNSSDTWRTERYRDASGHDVVVAKQQGKQDGIELTTAAKCTTPNKLSFEFFTPGNFQVAQANGQSMIGYKLGVDGQPLVGRQAPFVAADTLILDASLPATAGAPAVDMRTSGRLNFQLFTSSGPTNVGISLGDHGLSEVMTACGIDPAKAVTLQPAGADPALNRAAPSLLNQPSAGSVTLQTLSTTWDCSGDLGNFKLRVSGYTYQFGDDSPWGAIDGKIAIGASEAGVDNNPSYPLTLGGGQWNDDDTPWSYSPMGDGTIYYVAPDSGQSAQCTRD